MALTLAQAHALSPARQRAAQMFAAPSYAGGSSRQPGVGYIEDEEEKQSALSALTRQAGNSVEVLGKLLDYPGAIARGVLAGDPTSGFSWDSDRRTSGRELLESYGLLGKDANPYFATGAGLAAEILTDPLAIFSTAPLRIGGQAAKAAGILDKASDVATMAMGAGDFAAGAKAASDQLRTGRAAYKWLGDLLPAGKALNRENAALRPLVGPRVARSMTTLEDVVKAAPDQNDALGKVTAYLDKRGLSYNSVKDETLGGAFGAGFFGLVDPVVANPTAARGMLDAMDYLGQATRWSAPVRFGSQLFSKKVAGEFGAIEQLQAMRGFDLVQGEQKAARVLGAENARLVASLELNPTAQQLLGTDTLNSPKGRDFLTRLYEGAETQSDLKIVSAIGKPIEDVIQNWDTLRKMTFDESKKLGMYSAEMTDRFGLNWSPRVAREADFGDYGKGLSRATNTARMLEHESRQKYLVTPGGTVDHREISQLPKVQQLIREGREEGAISIAEVGASIKKYIDDKWGPNAPDPRVRPFKAKVYQVDAKGKAIMEPVLDANGNAVLDAKGKPKMQKKIAAGEVISQRQGERIARFMVNRRRPNTPLDVPMFGEHPTVSQARALVSQGTARAHTRHVYESIAESAIATAQNPNAISGTKYKPVGQAIDEVSKRIGLTLSTKTGGASKAVRDQLRQSIAKANGIADWKTVDLNQFTLPEEVFNRLIRINDFYNSPRAQESMVWLFDAVSQLFKGFALAFPATKVRDMYSNAFLLTLEAGNVPDVLWGLKTAKAIVGGRMDDATALLKELPGYNLANATEIQKKLTADVASTGVLETLSTSDLITSNQTGVLNHLVPGSQPASKLGALRELVPDGSRSLGQMVGDQFQFRGIRLPFQKQAGYETRNAMLNAAQKFSDYTDSVARLGGMLSLMRQGNTADVAAKRITSALVDYGSLTMFERQTLRRIFPWYAYTSRIGKYAVGQLANNPGGGYAQTIRGLSTLQQSDDDTYVPTALRQQFAFRIPDEARPYLGIDPNDPNTTFLSDIDIPAVDVGSLIGIKPTLFGSVQSTAYNLAQQANPFVKSAMELATGMDTWSRRPLQQSTTPADRIYKAAYKGITGAEAPTGLNPLVRQAINVTPGPWQRFISLGGGLSDERIPLQQRLAKQAFNSLTGVKLRTVDPAWQLSDAMQNLSEGGLSDFMVNYSEPFIPKSRLPQVPAEFLPQYQLYRTLGRDLREVRQARQQ